jgi:hypothetical protein
MLRDAAGVARFKRQLLAEHMDSNIPWPAAARSAKAQASLGFIPRWHSSAWYLRSTAKIVSAMWRNSLYSTNVLLACCSRMRDRLTTGRECPDIPMNSSCKLGLQGSACWLIYVHVGVRNCDDCQRCLVFAVDARDVALTMYDNNRLHSGSKYMSSTLCRLTQAV